MNQDLVGLIADLAREVGTNDPIDFETLALDEESVYNLMSANVLEKYQNTTNNELVMLATITHLLVENFILNVKLRKGIDDET